MAVITQELAFTGESQSRVYANRELVLPPEVVDVLRRRSEYRQDDECFKGEGAKLYVGHQVLGGAEHYLSLVDVCFLNCFMKRLKERRSNGVLSSECRASLLRALYPCIYEADVVEGSLEERTLVIRIPRNIEVHKHAPTIRGPVVLKPEDNPVLQKGSLLRIERTNL